MLTFGLIFVSLFFWIPAIASLLWASTLVITTITFNWIFVLVIGVFASLVTGSKWASDLKKS